MPAKRQVWRTRVVGQNGETKLRFCIVTDERPDGAFEVLYGESKGDPTHDVLVPALAGKRWGQANDTYFRTDDPLVRRADELELPAGHVQPVVVPESTWTSVLFKNFQARKRRVQRFGR